MAAGGTIIKVGDGGLKGLVFITELVELLVVVDAEAFVGVHKVGDFTLETAFSDLIHI